MLAETEHTSQLLKLYRAVLAQTFWGRAFPHQPLHHRVHFLCSPKPKKYELHNRPTFEINQSIIIIIIIRNINSAPITERT